MIRGKNLAWDYYWGNGNTAEAVAKQFKSTREDQDEFAIIRNEALRVRWRSLSRSNCPIEVAQNLFRMKMVKKATKKNIDSDQDEGPRKGTNLESLAGLRPVFAAGRKCNRWNPHKWSDGCCFRIDYEWSHGEGIKL